MAKISFFVDTIHSDKKVESKNSDKKVSIRVRLRSTHTNQHVATGLRVQLQYWDFNKEVKGKLNKNYQKLNKTSFKGRDPLKSKIQELKTYLTKQIENEKEFPKGWLADKVDRYNDPQKYLVKDRPQSMYEWMENWADNSPNTYRVVRSYHITINSLKEYSPSLEWDDLNLDFFDSYLQLLQKRGLAKNTIADRVKVLKTFCNAAFDRNVHKNDTFKQFRRQTETSVNVYLSVQELEEIAQLDLINRPYLDRVRDLFLVGAWTGCRFSDLSRITADSIDNGYIRIEQQKTQKRVVIPLHSVVKKILVKYNWQLPDMISNQKFNSYLKEIAKLSKIEGKVNKSITKGGKRTAMVLNKWEMISSHCARRSFATNLYKSGFPSISIMAITGHQTEKAFLLYIKVSEEEHAELLMKHWDRLDKNL
ncbi:site-specific integrase [bacterium]|nr:site-specific integrase [bacterium]